MCNQSLFKWWRHLHYLQNNSERQLNLMQTFENLLLQNYLPKFLNTVLHINRPWVCVIKVCSNGGATYIICEIISEDNLNIAN